MLHSLPAEGLRPKMTVASTSSSALSNGKTNALQPDDRPAHDWYRFVLSFPPHLVSEYVFRFELPEEGVVLDPFCGTGTTLVECKKLGIRSVGVEAHPLSHFASQVKVDWTPDPDDLLSHSDEVAAATLERLGSQGITDEGLPLFGENDAANHTGLRELPEHQAKLLLKNSISPLPLHKSLVLLETLRERRQEASCRHQLLALAKALVTSIGNLHFGPEVGIGKIKTDVSVVGSWLSNVSQMARSLRALSEMESAESVVHRADARSIVDTLPEGSVDAVITSPPYPNEKDYTRTTRLESVLLGFIDSRESLRAVKEELVRSNTRNVFKDDDDDEWVLEHSEIQRIAREIENRRQELNKTSGFERLYHRVAKLYFGGMYRHLSDLRKILRPGAHLAYVVGDQASYLRIMIRTGQLLADIATSLGYELVDIDLFRTRLATATREQLREEVVVLRWPGS